MKKGIIAFIVSTGICFQQTNAQVLVTPSLNDAISAGIKNSVVLKNDALLQQKAEDERKSVLNKYLPTVSANASYMYLNNELNIDLPSVTLPLPNNPQLFSGTTSAKINGNIFAAGITAKQVIFSGGQIMNGAKALAAKNEGNQLMNDIKSDQIIKEIISTFDQLRLIDQAFTLLNESENRLEKETERVEKAIQQGLAVPYDRDKIKLASLNLESKKTEIIGKKQLIYLKLNTLTGYNNEQIDAVVYDLTPIHVDTELAVTNRNELKAFDAFSKALDYSLKKEKGSKLPTVGAFASYSYGSLFNSNTNFALPISGNETNISINHATLSPNWMVGAVVKWEIFSGFEHKHKIESVKIDQRILQNKKEDAEQMINLQLKNSLVNYNVQLNQLSIADQKEKIATNNLITADKQYKLGLINISERLTAETETYEAALNTIQSIINQRLAALETYSAYQPLINSIQVKQ